MSLEKMTCGVNYTTNLLRDNVNGLIDTMNTGIPKVGGITAEDFDRPSGTLLNGVTTVSGHTLTATGAGASTLNVQNGYMQTLANTYVYIRSDQLIKKVTGVFSVLNDVEDQCVIMFNGGDESTPLDKLIHLEVTSSKVAMKFTSTGAANLIEPAQKPTEKNGLSPTSNHLLPDITKEKCRVTLNYIEGATALEDIIEAELPDGRTLQWTNDPTIREVMATCYTGTWQGFTDNTRWYYIGSGDSKAEKQNPLGGGISKAAQLSSLDITQKYLGERFLSFTPTSVGWYEIVSGVSMSGALSALTGELEIFSSDVSGRTSYIKGYVNIFRTLTPVFEYDSRGFGALGVDHISKLRLSTDNAATGSKKLEIYIANYAGDGDQVVVRFKGAGDINRNPVVGSTQLSGTTREQPINDPSYGFREYTGVSGGAFEAGKDKQRQILVNSYASSRDFTLDDTIGNETDTFEITRAAGFANNAVIKNLSDNSEVVTLEPSTSAVIGFRSGKYKLIRKMTQ